MTNVVLDGQRIEGYRAVFKIGKVIGAILLAFVLQWASVAFAVDTETLPARVRMAQMRFGVVSGLSDTWASNGKLYDLGQTRSVTFDAATLARVNEKARLLIQALDYFGSRSLGEKIQLGTLNVHTMPEVTFAAPVMAYGINDRWSLGVGLPVVRYSNRLSLSASASNLDFYREQFSGIDRQLDEVLNVDLVAEAQKVIAQKGYQALGSRDQTFLGDIQVALIHKLPDLRGWRLSHQMTLTLPTGPKDNPDDLVAINSFGRTAVDNTLVASMVVAPQLTWLPYAGVLLPIPDKTVKRVPKDEEDRLPDPNAKREVIRYLAPTYTLGSELAWAYDRHWTIKSGFEASGKGSDRYEGWGRTDLLARNTDSMVGRVFAGIGYSTVEDYQNKLFKIPGRLAFNLSDTIVGRNIERQLRTEFAAMLFF